ELFQNRAGSGEELRDATGKRGDVAIHDALARCSREIERAHRPKLPTAPEREHVRFVFRAVDLRHEDRVSFQRFAQCLYELPEELVAVFCRYSRGDYANELGDLLVPQRIGGEPLFDLESLRDFASQLSIGLLKRNVGRLQALLVVPSLELGAGARGED